MEPIKYKYYEVRIKPNYISFHMKSKWFALSNKKDEIVKLYKIDASVCCMQ